MKQTLRSRIFYKYLISYFLVLMIPVLVLFFIFYRSFLGIITDEVSNKNMDMLMQVKNSIDSQLTHILKISYQIQNNTNLSMRAVNENTTSGRAAIEAINSYSSVSVFIHEILLYHHGDKNMYSSASTYTPFNFFNYIYQYENLDETDFFKTCEISSDISVWPATDIKLNNISRDQFVTVFISLPHGNPSKNSTVVFLIRQNTFAGFLKGIVEKNDGNVLIMDQNKNIITSLKTEENIIIQNLKDTLFELDNASAKKIDINNTPYIISRVASDVAQWSYITLIPEKKISSQLSYIKNQAFYGLLIIILLGGIVIYGITYMNYNPLRKLMLYFEEKMGHIHNTDEINSMRSAFEHLYNSSNMIKERFDSNRGAIKSALLLGLIKGEYRKPEDFNNKGREVDVILSGTKFACVIIKIKNTVVSEDLDTMEIINSVEALLQPYIQTYGREENVLSDTMTFILSLDDGDYDILDSILLEVKTLLLNKYRLNVTIGVGNQYAALSEFSKSYNEASIAVDYRLTKGSNLIIFYSTVCGQSDSLTIYPREELEKLQLYLLQVDQEKTTESINTLIDIIEQSNMPLHIARTLCFDIINTVVKTLDGIYSEFQGKKLDYTRIEALLEFESVDQLSLLLKNMVTDVCNYIKEHREKDNEEQIEQLKRYIKDNYHDYNFSAYNMAEHFNLSISNLSHYFKNKVGLSITDHVNRLRSDEAKKLLSETDITVQDIVSRIGYLNVSSFIRKFRQETGFTPVKYRELKRKM